MLYSGESGTEWSLYALLCSLSRESQCYIKSSEERDSLGADIDIWPDMPASRVQHLDTAGSIVDVKETLRTTNTLAVTALSVNIERSSLV